MILHTINIIPDLHTTPLTETHHHLALARLQASGNDHECEGQSLTRICISHLFGDDGVDDSRVEYIFDSAADDAEYDKTLRNETHGCTFDS